MQMRRRRRPRRDCTRASRRGRWPGRTACRDKLYKYRSSGENGFSVRGKVFGKSYSLENSLQESVFREDLFLYNCLQTAFFCSLCQADCNSVQMVESHIAGRKHQMNLAKAHAHACPNALGGGFGGFGKGSE